MPRNYLYDNVVPDGVNVFSTGDLDLRPPNVPESARPSEIVDGRREWLWMEEGAPVKMLARLQKPTEPRREDLGLEDRQPEATERDRSFNELIGEPEPHVDDSNNDDDGMMSKIISGIVTPVDMMADLHWQASEFAQMPGRALVKELTGKDIAPDDDVETIMRGIHKEVFRAAALETALIALTPYTGGSSTAVAGAHAAATASRVGKAVQVGRQLLKARASRVLTEGRRIRNTSVAAGVGAGVFGGIGAASGAPEIAQQSQGEFAMDAGAEIAGQLAAEAGLFSNLIKILPPPLRHGANIVMGSGRWPILRKAFGHATARVAGSAVGATTVGLATEQDPLAIGATVGIPGAFTFLKDAPQAAKILRNLDGADPTLPDAEGPSAAAIRLSELLDDESAAAVKRIKSLDPKDARVAAELNRLHNIDQGRAITGAAYLADNAMLERRTKTVRPSEHLKFVSTTAEAQGRALFPTEFNENDLTEFAKALDAIKAERLAKPGLAKPVKGVLPVERFGNADKIDLSQVKPDVVADRIAKRWKDLDGMLNASFDSPENFKEYATLVQDIERYMATTTGAAREQMAPMVQKLKDSVVTKGILGSAFAKRVNPNVTANAGTLGRIEYDVDKISQFVENKENFKVLTDLYGAKGARAIKDIAALMSFQSQKPEAATVIGKSISTIVNFSEARLGFHLISGSLTGPQSKGFEMLKMLGLTAAGAQANEMFISASRFMEMGIAQPERMRNLVKAIQSGNATQQKVIVRSLLRTEIFNEPDEEDEPVEEAFELFAN